MPKANKKGAGLPGYGGDIPEDRPQGPPVREWGGNLTPTFRKTEPQVAGGTPLRIGTEKQAPTDQWGQLAITVVGRCGPGNHQPGDALSSKHGPCQFLRAS